MIKQVYKLGSLILHQVKRFGREHDVEEYRKSFGDLAVNEKRFFNIGAGDFFHPCWTNVDHPSMVNSGMKHEFIPLEFFDHKPLPVQDNLAELVYCSHAIEHVDNDSVSFLFRDVFRMLKKGGTFRIVVPDIKLSYRAWQRGDRKFFFWIDEDFANNNIEKQCLNTPMSKASLSQIWLEDFAAEASEIALVGSPSRISDETLKKLFNEKPFDEALDFCISHCTIENQKKYPYRHMNWFHFAKLENMLRECGFSKVQQSAYLQSDVAVLRNPAYFDQTLPQLSMYVEAVKQ